MRLQIVPLLLIVAFAAHAAPTDAEETLYRLPDGFVAPTTSEYDDPAGLTARSLTTLAGRSSVWDRRVARRVLAALGDEAMPAIVDALATSDRRVRRDLITAIADSTASAAPPILIAATRDASWAVREQAVEGLGARGRPDDLPAILARLDDPVWRVRAAVVTALRRLVRFTAEPDTTTILSAIDSRLEDRDREVRRAAAWALMRLDHEPSLVRAYAVLWRGPRRDRSAVIRELPDTQSPALLAILDEIMADSDDEIAFAAAERFAAVRGVEVFERHDMRRRLRNDLMRLSGRAAPVVRRLRAAALPFLIECIALRAPDIHMGRPTSTEAASKIRVRHILDLMAALGTDEAIPEFRRIIEESKSEILVKHAVEVASLAFPKQLEASFEKRFLSPDDIVYSTQGRLLKALAGSNPTAAAPLLEQAAASGARDLHNAVLDVVAKLGSRCDAGGLLRSILRTSRNAGVLERALPLAARALGAEAEPLVLPRLDDPDLRIRVHAVNALTTRPSAENAARLRELFRNAAPIEVEDEEEGEPDPEDDEPSLPPSETGDAITEHSTTLERKDALRRTILRALPLVAPEPDVPFLAAALEAPEWRVREAAAWALGESPSEAAADVIMAALDREEDRTVRDALITALVGCPGEPAATRLDSMLRDGLRGDRNKILNRLAATDHPVPDAVREGLGDLDWDASQRSRAAAVLARNGSQEDLDRLVALLAEGAPPELELIVLGALGDREAREQIPGLLALLPDGPLEDLDPGRRDFVLTLIECLGRIGDARAADALRSLLARTRPRADEDLGTIDGFRLDGLGLSAQALARVSPEVAIPELLDVVLDPVVARLHWDRGIDWTRTNQRLHAQVRGVCYGLQRVADAPLALVMGAALDERRRSGRLLELPPGYLAAVADTIATLDRKRPRKAAAARVREAMLVLPPRVSRHAFDAARNLATRHVFLGEPDDIVRTADRALDLLLLDPGLGKAANDRREEADFLAALSLIGHGAGTEDAAERLRLFQEAAALDTGNTDIAYYLAWAGLYRGIDLEHVQTWTRRAIALSSSGDSQRWTVLDLQGIVLRAAGELNRAEVFLRQAFEESRMAKSGMAPYHYAVVLCETERIDEARAVLRRALTKDDTWWDHARRERAFAPLREDDGLEKLLDEVRRTFD